MKLSEILPKMHIGIKYEIINEKDFDYLASVETKVDFSNCTYIDNVRFISKIQNSVSMILVNKEIANLLINRNFGICIIDNPRVVFSQIHNFLSSNCDYTGPKQISKIGKNCKISKLSNIAENNVIIGDNVAIEEFVSIKENVIIGDNTIIRAGCVIGGEGFECKNDGDSIFGVKHCGFVKIGKNVEIQYNSCVDKAIFPFDSTIIGDNCKLDDLVYVAHAVKIQPFTLVASHAAIMGRVNIGHHCWIGPSSVIRNGLTIGNNARCNMGSVVTKSVMDGCAVSGNFAIDHNEFIKKIKK